MSEHNDRTDDINGLADAELSPAATTTEDSSGESQQEQPKLSLQVEIKKPSACERRIVVRVARTDIDRYFDKEFSELMPQAQVPGFRPGRAPRKLVEKHFRKQIAEKVKLQVIYDAVEQINQEYQLTPISEPDLDIDAIELPSEGDMLFEFELEVRPEFDLPQWKGLKLRVPHREITDEDVQYHLDQVLENRGRLTPHDGPAQAGDYISADIVFRCDGKELTRYKELLVPLREKLSLADGEIADFGKAMEGVSPGETRTLSALITGENADEELRGRQAEAEFHVLEVKRIVKAELTPEFLEELGGYQSEAELRDAIRDMLANQVQYNRRKAAREQVSQLLTEAADWELPPQLLKRQTDREFRRAVMELEASGFSEEMVLAQANQLHRNASKMVAEALKEHFILERIAEEEKITVDEADFDREIALLAQQRRESPRRIRAQLEKAGGMDVLTNQIIERKVLDLILENAQYEQVPFEFPKRVEAALNISICAVPTADIPEAEHAGGAEPSSGRPGEPRRFG